MESGRRQELGNLWRPQLSESRSKLQLTLSEGLFDCIFSHERKPDSKSVRSQANDGPGNPIGYSRKCDPPNQHRAWRETARSNKAAPANAYGGRRGRKGRKPRAKP